MHLIFVCMVHVCYWLMRVAAMWSEDFTPTDCLAHLSWQTKGSTKLGNGTVVNYLIGHLSCRYLCLNTFHVLHYMLCTCTEFWLWLAVEMLTIKQNNNKCTSLKYHDANILSVQIIVMSFWPNFSRMFLHRLASDPRILVLTAENSVSAKLHSCWTRLSARQSLDRSRVLLD